jgi:hypothetical protein
VDALLIQEIGNDLESVKLLFGQKYGQELIEGR